MHFYKPSIKMSASYLCEAELQTGHPPPSPDLVSFPCFQTSSPWSVQKSLKNSQNQLAVSVSLCLKELSFIWSHLPAIFSSSQVTGIRERGMCFFSRVWCCASVKNWTGFNHDCAWNLLHYFQPIPSPCSVFCIYPDSEAEHKPSSSSVKRLNLLENQSHSVST